MPWRGWENPKDEFGKPFARLIRGKSRWLWNRNDITNQEIDKLIKQGKNPRSKLNNKIKQMSPYDRKKVEAQIANREKKAQQGKGKK